MPEYILREKGLVPLRFAIRNVHFPSDQNALEKARYRLKWEELFLLQISLLKQKYVRSRSAVGIPMPKVGPAFNACYNSLPYELTGAQKRVIKEIRSDMMSGHQIPGLHHGTERGACPAALRQHFQILGSDRGPLRTADRIDRKGGQKADFGRFG